MLLSGVRGCLCAAKYIKEAALARHVLTAVEGPSANVIKLKPPMTFAEADADRLCAVLDEVRWEGCQNWLHFMPTALHFKAPHAYGLQCRLHAALSRRHAQGQACYCAPRCLALTALLRRRCVQILSEGVPESVQAADAAWKPAAPKRVQG
jgi:hypothetical protein